MGGYGVNRCEARPENLHSDGGVSLRRFRIVLTIKDSWAGVAISCGSALQRLQSPGKRIAAGLPNDSFEHFQINIPSANDRDHSLSFESLFSFEETPNAQGS